MHKYVRAPLIATALLLVPFAASFFVDGWLWTGSDYVFAWVLFAGAALGYTFVASRAGAPASKAAAGLGVAAAFFLVWVSAAVGIIGDDNPANLLYGGVLATGFLGACASGLKPRGLSRAMFATAVAQALVPVIGLMAWPPSAFSWSPGVLPVFVLNAGWVTLWLGSALLFRRAEPEAAK